MNGNQLGQVQHIVVLMLENRSFDHMLGWLYAGAGNVSPSGQPFDGLTGDESNPDKNGNPVQVLRITPQTPNAYSCQEADPGEGYNATNSQLFGSIKAPTVSPAPTGTELIRPSPSAQQHGSSGPWSAHERPFHWVSDFRGAPPSALCAGDRCMPAATTR
jgi:hypothetical protein